MGIEKENLRKRKWPLPPFPIGQEVVDREKRKQSYACLPYPNDYLKSCYVAEEKVRAVSLPFLPGECAINSLVKDRSRRIFGITSGEKSHLFSYNPKDKSDNIADLGVIEENCKKSSLVVSGDNNLFIGIAPKIGDGYIYFYDYKNVSSRIEKLICPVKNEGIISLSFDNKKNRIYGLSSETGTFFIFYPDKCLVEIKGQVDKEHLFSEILVVTGDGDVFGGARWTQFFKYDTEKEILITLDIKAPTIKGREMYNKIKCLVWDEDSSSLYGGTSADGILFRFYPEEEKIISLGKSLNQPYIRCLTVGKDKCIYGIAGKNCCHLFKYSPDECDLQDLGILYTSSPRYWHGYEFDCAVTGEDGEIYLGENDRISHLFIYFPSYKGEKDNK